MEHEQHHPTGPTFDTLKAAEALQQAGFTGVQARAVTQTIVEAQDNLASKADIRELRVETKADIRELRVEMKAEFKTLRGEMAELRGEMAELRAEVQGVRSEVQALSKAVSMLEKLIFGVTIPMMVGIFVAVVSFAVDHFFFSG